ncbi:hypothetical protein HPP92_001061 [Vanilla planifolia]|uniref:Uncharacterized protein n=1 Tax=Vanilla planifolia TaxID=51239 RepID=A0A835RZ76_VANPL|nr:hypothetical protein HPP92_001061 [Vanilla planifolia]
MLWGGLMGKDRCSQDCARGTGWILKSSWVSSPPIIRLRFNWSSVPSIMHVFWTVGSDKTRQWMVQIKQARRVASVGFRLVWSQKRSPWVLVGARCLRSTWVMWATGTKESNGSESDSGEALQSSGSVWLAPDQAVGLSQGQSWAESQCDPGFGWNQITGTDSYSQPVRPGYRHSDAIAIRTFTRSRRSLKQNRLEFNNQQCGDQAFAVLENNHVLVYKDGRSGDNLELHARLKWEMWEAWPNVDHGSQGLTGSPLKSAVAASAEIGSEPILQETKAAGACSSR